MCTKQVSQEHMERTKNISIVETFYHFFNIIRNSKHVNIFYAVQHGSNLNITQGLQFVWSSSRVTPRDFGMLGNGSTDKSFHEKSQTLLIFKA